MTLRPTEITLSERSPRYANWIAIFGTPTVQVLGVIPQRAPLEAGGPEREFFLVDLNALLPEQMDRLVAFVSTKYGVPVDTVRATIADHGMPLLADDCITTFDARLFL